MTRSKKIIGAFKAQGQNLCYNRTTGALAATGTAQITVVNPGGSASNALPFTITPVQALVLNNLVPNHAPAGNAAFVLTLAGTGFSSGATVTFGSLSGIQPASIASDTISVRIPANLVGAVGTVRVQVVNPNGTAPNAQTFTITPVSSREHVLWDNPDGSATVWNVDDVTGAMTFHTYGPPVSGSVAVGVGAYP